MPRRKNNTLPGPSHWRANIFNAGVWVTRDAAVHPVVLFARDQLAMIIAGALWLLLGIIGMLLAQTIHHAGHPNLAPFGFLVALFCAPASGIASATAAAALRRRTVRAGRVLYVPQGRSPLADQARLLADALTHQPQHVQDRTADWCARAWDLLVAAGPLVAQAGTAHRLRTSMEDELGTSTIAAHLDEVVAAAAGRQALDAYDSATRELLEQMKALTDEVVAAVDVPNVPARVQANIEWKKEAAATLKRVAVS